MKRAILILSLALLGATLAIVPAGGAQDKIDPRLESALTAGDGMISAIVVMADQAELHGTQRADRAQSRLAVLTALQGTARASQTSVLARLGVLKGQGKVAAFESYWIFSGFAVTASADVINELAARSDVARIEPDAEIVMTQSVPAEPNLTAVAAPTMWSNGFTGQGVVVANLDSGVDFNHPDLTANYRGGGNSWFDAYGQHATPYDASGHGTGTMGIIAGGSAGGTAIGMAPGAQWIAAKVFNDAGSSSSSAIHAALQWLLDPDGNPATDDAPDVVNNSWTLSIPGCYADFQVDLQALRAAGIVPVFSAGNAGWGGNSSRSPANLPEALSVGATDNSDNIAWFSSRGPSACADDIQFPDIVAPGVAIRTADIFDGYWTPDGTSFSAPHVAGALALLLSAHPALTPTHQEAALLESAVDLGVAGPDSTYGWGRLDVNSAHAWLDAGGQDPGEPQPTTTTTSTTTSTTTTTTATTTTTSTTTTTTTPGPGLFFDDFESGNLAAWSKAETNSGQLSVTRAAALKGDYGMQSVISGSNNMYVADPTPAASVSYAARFWFDPNGTTVPKRKLHDLFIGVNDEGTAVLRLQMRSSSGGYQVRGLARDNRGKDQATGWYSISDDSHSIEVTWRAASSSNGSDGEIRLVVDDVVAGTKSGIKNGPYSIEEARLGPQGIGQGTDGTEFFDDFSTLAG